MIFQPALSQPRALSTDIEVNLPSGSNSGGPTFKPTLRYIDQTGPPRSGQTFLASSRYNYAIGAKLPILFNPANPGSLRMDSWFSLWGFSLIFLITGLLIMAGGAALWVFDRKKQPRPCTQMKRPPKNRSRISAIAQIAHPTRQPYAANTQPMEISKTPGPVPPPTALQCHQYRPAYPNQTGQGERC